MRYALLGGQKDGSNFQGQAQVWYYGLGTVGMMAVTYHLLDGAKVSIPMSLLENDDRIFNYVVFAQSQLNDNVYSTIRDFMPDKASYSIVVIAATTAVPEPATVLLLGSGLLGLEGYWRKKLFKK